MNHQTLGTATTVGELRKLLEPYAEDVSFGFFQQPIQTLYEHIYEGKNYVCFDVRVPVDIVEASEHLLVDEWDFEEFVSCGECDGHPACEDFGCAIKAGIPVSRGF